MLRGTSVALKANTTNVSEIATLTGLDAFNALEREWNSLVTAHNNSLFLRHEFMRVWLESFAPHRPVQVLTGRSADGSLLAVLPLILRRGFIRGIPVRELVAPANAHSCRFDMVAEDPGAAGEAVFRHLAARKDWDVLRIPDVPEGGQAWHIFRTAVAEGFPVGAWPAQRSPFLLLPSTEEELQGSVSSQLRATARRKLRQMEKRSPVQIERIPTSDDLALVLEDFFQVERSGWKGKKGTACDQDTQTRTFYTRLAEVAAEKNWLALYRLTLGGQTVALHFGLIYDGVYLLPKLAFREEFSELSPGLVLMHEVVRDCIRQQINTIDFLGTVDEWKSRWTHDVVPHYWLYIFSKSFKGRLLWRMKFKWAAAAKQILERVGG
jgi:CelD/BcsL family acetyltransferase involved in cellulose biosynthesis